MNLKSKNPDEIIQKFTDCTANEIVNWKHKNGSIFMAGGILSRLNKKGEQFFAINGKWVKA